MITAHISVAIRGAETVTTNAVVITAEELQDTKNDKKFFRYEITWPHNGHKHGILMVATKGRSTSDVMLDIFRAAFL